MANKLWNLDDFDVEPKHTPREAQRRWRSAVGAVVKNRRRRFRFVADLDKRDEAEKTRKTIQECTVRSL
ncbi:hypothetical protein TIFTF001_024514 [Ficus carica]|uniref:Calcium-transporting P-type ATPase N-terminal autoinhibitory domain-containing protein n=1 Tax=Ficus carica TaxID=3494 RepID=A0AA88AGW0_FICCA|nr:hypothetical protein TIFTF001_024514 [Ficus carica]